ncbi:transglutaminase domain-containing protein [Nocardioides sp. zg-ZUI104]|uniref:transglutaminase-like domain-containing protein n=1 Tax=Nocardioides faecalis TaxID=2803858 RepID=UPI001BCD5491|nr:transglutaminase-like domain-containing protein [Nocardioides faecalis]MBS4754145.1 transglutaminase domain-containing protein [Nocardioides faecalis]
MSATTMPAPPPTARHAAPAGGPAGVPVAVDAVLLALALGIALWPLGDAYAGGRWALAAGVGVLAGGGATLLAARLRWGPVLSVLLLAVAFLVLGPAVAAPHQAIAGVLPGIDAERTLVVGVVESWRTALTLPVPLGAERGELVVPFLVALLGAALAASLAWRSRWPGAAGLAVAGTYVAAAAFGTRDAELPLLRGVLLLVVLLVWSRWRALRHLRASWTRRVLLGTVVLLLAGAVGWAGATLVGERGTREVLRDHVDPPLAEVQFKSPLAAYRSFYKDHKNDVLFTFTDLPAGDVCVRLATMDTFDGIVWNVSTTDARTGTSAFGPAPAAEHGDAVGVEVGARGGLWVPTVGRATGATREHDAAPGERRELLLNPGSGALAEYHGSRTGDTYRVDWEPGPLCTNDARAVAADRSVPFTAPPLTIEPLDEMTGEWLAGAAAASDYERVVELSAGFADGYFNDGLDPRKFGYSSSGHGAKRLADLAADPARMVGNDEQYAAALAYSVQRLGIPARVVLGFEKVRADGTVTGDDIAAWVEVPFEGHGWMRFDPTPPEDRTPPPQNDSPDEVPQPYVVQPPVLPQEPADVQGVPPEGSGRDADDSIWDLLWRILGWLWLALRVLLVLAPIWGVWLLKRLRRRRRRRAGDPVTRVSGGWRELTDRARDLGVRMPAGATRAEHGRRLAERFPDADTVGLAVIADRHVFGAGQPSRSDVTAFWADVDTAVRQMRRQTPRWRRALAWASPASLPWRDVVRRTSGRLAGAARRIGIGAAGGRASRKGFLRRRGSSSGDLRAS